MILLQKLTFSAVSQPISLVAICVVCHELRFVGFREFIVQFDISDDRGSNTGWATRFCLLEFRTANEIDLLLEVQVA